MLNLNARTRETHPTFCTVEVTVTDYNLDPVSAPEQLFIVHCDRITNDAKVFHQGRLVNTQHDLELNVTQADVEAFAICATVSLAYKIKG